jgi:hypothetical protein
MYADDIWLFFMAQLNDTKIVKTSFGSQIMPIYNFKDSKLSSVNVDNGFNDIQFINTINYYIEYKKLDPLFNVMKSSNI